MIEYYLQMGHDRNELWNKGAGTPRDKRISEEV